MKYCSNCGGAVALKIPAGDSLPRHVCDACSTIHYQNPKMIVGCIAEWEDRVLGLWTVPAGFMENGETTAQGAARETLEEANARVEVGPLYAMYNIPHINQVYILFRARLLDLNFSAGTESLEVQLFDEKDVPWESIAFATVRNTLNHYYADRKAGEYRFHLGTIERAPVRS
jgi:ADP-ribose pyrophosphatase YjhB (NUDIX family)